MKVLNFQLCVKTAVFPHLRNRTASVTASLSVFPYRLFGVIYIREEQIYRCPIVQLCELSPTLSVFPVSR